MDVTHVSSFGKHSVCVFNADTYSQFMPLFTREAAEHTVLLSALLHLPFGSIYNIFKWKMFYLHVFCIKSICAQHKMAHNISVPYNPQGQLL